MEVGYYLWLALSQCIQHQLQPGLAGGQKHLAGEGSLAHMPFNSCNPMY